VRLVKISRDNIRAGRRFQDIQTVGEISPWLKQTRLRVFENRKRRREWENI
jgi:hypothetical protein